MSTLIFLQILSYMSTFLRSSYQPPRNSAQPSFTSVVQWLLVVLQWQNPPCDPERIFLIGHHCKRDICKTAARTPPTANKVGCDSFYSEFWIHGLYVFEKNVPWDEKSNLKAWLTAEDDGVPETTGSDLTARCDPSEPFETGVSGNKSLFRTLSWIPLFMV